jgi:peroxiredoxin-like protein
MATHEYKVAVEWTGGRDGHGAAAPEVSGSRFELAVPPEFGGAGGATNPEELLTSAIGACYSMTYGIIAANRKVPLEGLTTEVTGEVDQNGAMFNYVRVTLRPTIRLTADATDEQVKVAEEVAHKADGYCIITNAVRGKVAVTVEPTVQRG